jgi:hypothetical protein
MESKMLLKFIAKINNFIIGLTLRPATNQATKIIKDAPICCGSPAKFVGQSIGFVSTRTYQCEKCNKVIML